MNARILRLPIPRRPPRERWGRFIAALISAFLAAAVGGWFSR